MKRGFKAHAERISAKLRSDLGFSERDRLDPKEFLRSIGIQVWDPQEIPNISQAYVEQLTVHDPDSWSGVTVREANAAVIVVNPTHPRTRQANTLMHEWAHIELRHKPNRVDRSDGGLLLLSDYPDELEEEADWLAGAVLLPREGLMHFRGQGIASEAIADHYGVSMELTTWRLRMTGIERQLRARQRFS